MRKLIVFFAFLSMCVMGVSYTFVRSIDFDSAWSYPWDCNGLMALFDENDVALNADYRWTGTDQNDVFYSGIEPSTVSYRWWMPGTKTVKGYCEYKVNGVLQCRNIAGPTSKTYIWQTEGDD